MHYSELPPPAALADFVHCFWFLRGSEAGAEHPVVADGRPEIILHLADPFLVATNGAWHQQAHTLLAGQLLTPIWLRPGGVSDVMGIRFRTDGARALLDAPLDTVTDRVVPLAELHPLLARELHHAAGHWSHPAQRIAAVTPILRRHLRRRPDPSVRSMLGQLDQSHAPSIASVADHHGLAARTVERRLRAATGLTPVELRAVLRFRRCYRLLESDGPGRRGLHALSAGFYDQAHCIREFKRFTGAAPTEWFGRETGLASAFLTGRAKIEKLKS